MTSTSCQHGPYPEAYPTQSNTCCFPCLYYQYATTLPTSDSIARYIHNNYKTTQQQYDVLLINMVLVYQAYQFIIKHNQFTNYVRRKEIYSHHIVANSSKRHSELNMYSRSCDCLLYTKKDTNRVLFIVNIWLHYFYLTWKRS